MQGNSGRLCGTYLPQRNHRLSVTEKVDLLAVDKRYWPYDFFRWSPGDDHTHLPGHDNPQMHEDVVERFADQPYISIIRSSVPESFQQGSHSRSHSPTST